MNNVILICGQAENGKTTLAELIKKHLDTQPNGEVFDQTLIRNNGQSVKDLAIKKLNWNGEKDARGRQLLLDITKDGYDKDPFYWEKETFTEAIMHKEFTNKYCNFLIIPDWRFASTLEYFKDKMDKVTTVRISRPDMSGTHTKHSSENDLFNFEVDIEVCNNGSLSQLEKVAKNIASRCSN